MSSIPKKPTILSILSVLCCSLSLTLAASPCSPSESLETLVKHGRINEPSIDESSGLVRSRRWANLFWTHNDSGGNARIFAIRGDGTSLKNPSSDHSGVAVTGAKNIDWEDIALDDENFLIIGDIGNNISYRPELTLYRVREPDPFKHGSTEQAERVFVYFPESPSLAFNCEALFWAGGTVYLMTKTRGGNNTGLYRVQSKGPEGKAPLFRVGSFDFEAPVTAADASADGRLLAVLTYKAVWLFERPGETDNYLRGKRAYSPFRFSSCEAICFDGDRLLIGNERGDLFELDAEALHPLK